MARRWAWAALAAAMASSPVGAGAQEPPKLEWLGATLVPTGARVGGAEFGGLSSVLFHPGENIWYFLSDDRSERAPARFHKATVSVADGQPLEIRVIETVTLRRADGSAFPPPAEGHVDPEAMALRPDGQGFVWASEGSKARRRDPTLYETRLDGSLVREIAAPPPYRLVSDAAGVRDNLDLEAMDLTPDGRSAWIANEEPLLQDGDRPTNARGGLVRLTRIDLESGQVEAQLAYPLDRAPLAPAPAGGPVDNGLVELRVLDERRLLVLERNFAAGTGVSCRFYEVDLSEATPIAALDSLRDVPVTPVRKTLVADLTRTRLPQENYEGFAFGPTLLDGRRLLILVSDNNFNRVQATIIAAFAYRP